MPAQLKVIGNLSLWLYSRGNRYLRILYFCHILQELHCLVERQIVKLPWIQLLAEVAATKALAFISTGVVRKSVVSNVVQRE